MSKFNTAASRAAWRAKEVYRLGKWRSWRKRDLKDPSPYNHRHRSKWWDLYVEARDMRRKRDEQLKHPRITQISRRGLAFIVEREGVVLHPYNDAANNATIGVGHLIHLGPVTAADRAKYANFDRHDADVLLSRDLDRFEKVVAGVFKGAKLKATPNRFDACVSLAFNIGEGGFRNSTVAREIKAGNLRAAADAFLMWDNPSVLRSRRNLERSLFLR